MDQNLDAGSDKGPVEDLDVDSELQFLQKFKDLGLSIGDMENVLFTDIDRYKRMKLQLLKNTFHEEYGSPIPLTDVKNEIDMMERDLNDVPQPEGEDVELLLLGSPISEDPPVQEDMIDIGQPEPEIDETARQNADGSEPVFLEDEITDKISEEMGSEEVPAGNENYGLDRPSRRLKGSKPILIGAVAILIVILLIGSYSVFDMMDDGEDVKEDIEVEIILSDANPSAGELVFFSSSPTLDDMRYSWKILPDSFGTVDGTMISSELDVFFKETGRYDISLMVEHRNREYSSSTIIDVQSTEIELERENYQDITEYDVEGHLRLDRIDHIIDSTELKPYTVLDADFWTTENEPMKMEISGEQIDSMDGLGYVNKNVMRTVDQNLKISGYLETPNKVRSTTTGSTDLRQTTMIDLYTKDPTKMISDVDYDLTIQISSSYSYDYISSEKIHTYPSLMRTFSELRIEDISPERFIKLGDTGSTEWGSYTLDWETLYYDRVHDTNSLVLDLQLDRISMELLSIDDMEMKVWVGDGIGQMMKMVLNISSDRSIQTPYILDYSQTLSDITKGSTPLIFGDVQYQHDIIGDISERFPDVSDEYHSDWDILPRQGTLPSSIPSDFTAETAYDQFKDNPNYKAYLRAQSDPFGLFTNFSRVKGNQQWKFSIGDSSKDRCWNQTVFREAAPLGKTSRIDPVMVDRNDIGNILTYSAGEVAIKRLLSLIDPDSAQRIYGLSDIPDNRELDLDNFYIGTASDMDYPVIGLINPTLSERIQYGMFIASNDGTIEVGLDMKTGQLSYVRSSS